MPAFFIDLDAERERARRTHGSDTTMILKHDDVPPALLEAPRWEAANAAAMHVPLGGLAAWGLILDEQRNPRVVLPRPAPVPRECRPTVRPRGGAR